MQFLCLFLLTVSTAAHGFEAEIKAFERADRLQPPSINETLFIGSSSIRLWPKLSQYFPKLTIIQRGFGGSTVSDILKYKNRIMINYKPKTIVLYSGENDLAQGLSVDEVFKNYQKLFWLTHKVIKTKFIVLSVKVSKSRIYLKDKILSLNRKLKEEAKLNQQVQYLELYSLIADKDSYPKDQFFSSDKLHLSPLGYKKWSNRLLEVISN